jgi:chemotaxis protein CheC
MSENIRGDLSEMEFDALQEVGNIGTGNAATALSKMLGKDVDMNIPATKFIPIQKFADEFGGPERIISTIYLQVSGDMEGEVMFIFPREGTLELTDVMMGREPGSTKVITEMDESAFKEAANILAGAFLNSLARMLDAKIVPSIPHYATDMAQAILDFILIKVSQHADELLVIQTKIMVEGHNINGDFLVLFDKPSLDKMLEVLHKRYGHL